MPDIFEWLNEHLEVSRETYEKLSIYHGLLLKWQERVNLISPDTVGQIWQRHFLDALQVIPYIPECRLPIIDMGSGAGFPGMVVAIATGKEIHLIESDMKKSIFLREINRLTESRAVIHNCRIESQPIEKASVILSRACSALEDLLELSSLFVSRETTCLFHKGKNYAMEIDQARRAWQFDCITHPSMTDNQSVIIQLSHIARQETT